METIVFSLLNGVTYGLLLFMLSSGLTLIFSMMGVLNFAHASFYMVGAYLTATFTAWTGDFFLGLAIALPAALLFGIALERLIFAHLYDRDHLEQVLATFGLILILNEGVKMIWGAAPLSVPIPDILSGSIPLVGPLRYPVFRIVIIAAAEG